MCCDLPDFDRQELLNVIEMLMSWSRAYGSSGSFKEERDYDKAEAILERHKRATLQMSSTTEETPS